MTVSSGRTHGRRGTYVAGCRCQPCTAAEREYRRAWRRGERYEPPVRVALEDVRPPGAAGDEADLEGTIDLGHAAALLGVHPSTARDELPAIRWKRGLRFRFADVDAYIESRRVRLAMPRRSVGLDRDADEGLARGRWPR